MSILDTNEDVRVLSLKEYKEYTRLLEAIDPDEGWGNMLRPVFVVLLCSDKAILTKVARKFNKFKDHKYYHAAIGFGPSLKHLYAFNNGHVFANKITGGLSFESYDVYNHDSPNGELEVNCILLGKDKYARLKDNLNYFIHNKEKTRYDFLDILKLLFDKEGKLKLSLTQICSSFVDILLKSVDVDVTGKNSNLVAPDDLKYVRQNEKYFNIYKGKVSGYNIDKATEKVDKLSQEANNDFKEDKEKAEGKKEDKKENEEDKKDGE